MKLSQDCKIFQQDMELMVLQKCFWNSGDGYSKQLFEKEMKAGALMNNKILLVDDEKDIVDLLDEVISEMMSRFSVMMSRGDMEWPGRPLYVIVDEMADLIDSDMKKAFAQRLGKIARLGCAAKVILIAGAQNVTQDALNKGADATEDLYNMVGGNFAKENGDFFYFRHFSIVVRVFL